MFGSYLIITVPQFLSVVEAQGQRGIHRRSRRIRSEMQAMRRAVHVIEDIVHSGLNAAGRLP